MNSDVVKVDGSVEAWDSKKLIRSLVNAGALERTAERICATIEQSISPMASSSEIYKRAFHYLKHEARPAAARYSLRRALFEFGPDGHPFEDFIAEMFRKEGWTVEDRKLIPGKCVTHEVDIYATRNGEYLAGELKYHNDPGYKTDVKVALYVKARLDDIWQCDPKSDKTCPVDHGFLITNTKFTSQAIQYATCSGVNLLGWSYPFQGNLYDRIVANGLYPMTTLMTLRKAEKRLLLDKGIVTCELVRRHREVLREIGIPPERMGAILAEAETVCNVSHA